jgi:hypothetical protein
MPNAATPTVAVPVPANGLEPDECSAAALRPARTGFEGFQAHFAALDAQPLHGPGYYLTRAEAADRRLRAACPGAWAESEREELDGEDDDVPSHMRACEGSGDY